MGTFQMQAATVDEVAGALRGTARLERTAHHEAGHAVMALMYGHYIKSVSIIEDHRRGTFGITKVLGVGELPQEADLLCMLAGPIAELLHTNQARISLDVWCDLYQSALLEGEFEKRKDRPSVTMNRFFKNACLCVEVMAESDFRGAVNLLASRLVEHKYLSHERVIRQKDWELWDVYSTSDARVKHAKKSPKKAISEMIRLGKTLH
jgi:hypothetical protein